MKTQVNFSSWDNDFWDIVDGLPVPEKVKQVVVEKEITLNSIIEEKKKLLLISDYIADLLKQCIK